MIRDVPALWAKDSPSGLAKHVLTSYSSADFWSYAHLSQTVSHQYRDQRGTQLPPQGRHTHPMPLSMQHPLITSPKTWDQDSTGFKESTQAGGTCLPNCPNPYTLFSVLLPEHKVYTVLDLKDAFFFSLVRIKSAYPYLNGLTLN